MQTVEIDYYGQKIVLETGRMAKQTNASVLAHYADTRVLSTAVAAKTSDPNAPFFPLTCVYQVKTYAQGKILGGFIKRETRPSDHETLVSRLIDRPLRPLFPDEFKAETQVLSTVLSYDDAASPPAAALLASSAALYISDLPFHEPVAGVTVGRLEGKFVVNPSPADLQNSDLDLFVVASEKAIVMVESEAKEVSEADMAAALQFGYDAIQPLIALQKQLRELAGKTKKEVVAHQIDKQLQEKVRKFATPKLKKALGEKDKIARYERLSEVEVATLEEFAGEGSEHEASDVKKIVGKLKKEMMRSAVLGGKARVDGRNTTTVRPISCEINVLPRAHGSALFTRGETQALAVVTLAGKEGQQMVEDPTGVYQKSFYLHYNFPPYSVGEVKRLGPPGRREIGHGKLAERGLSQVIPGKGFPYTLRLVSEIFESNGSSSMATVCGGSLAMMAAGVPIAKHVAGIAMGMISEGDKYAILSDILGDEDHIGDMDFKVVGTKDGITALQMDIKIDGLSPKVMEEALAQAKEGRLHILSEMEKSVSEPLSEVSPYAPRYIQFKVPVGKIRSIIGPGGSVIKSITAETGASLDIEDSGMVNISSSNQKSAEAALAIIKELIKEIEIGATYEGTIKKIVDFGLFVECIPGSEGLVHISELGVERGAKLTDHFAEGQTMRVKAASVDNRGKIKLVRTEEQG